MVTVVNFMSYVFYHNKKRKRKVIIRLDEMPGVEMLVTEPGRSRRYLNFLPSDQHVELYTTLSLMPSWGNLIAFLLRSLLWNANRMNTHVFQKAKPLSLSNREGARFHSPPPIPAANLFYLFCCGPALGLSPARGE